MKGTAADLVHATLVAHGVTHFFGIDEPVHLVHAFEKGGIRPITVHDEKHAAIMAHGHAKATRRPGVCGAMPGPGATNLITGLLEALQSSTPIVAFVQDIARARRGRNAASELDHRAALGPFVKWIGRIDEPRQAAAVTHEAFRQATSGRPGPVVVLCPADVMGRPAEGAVRVAPAFAEFPALRPRADGDDMARAARLLAAARRPVLIAGGGCVISGAEAQMVALAETYGIPVATTMTGRGTIPDAHPLAVGVMGSSTGGRLGRGRIANRLVADADLVLIAGSRTGQVNTSEWTLPRPGTTVVHLDIDAAEPGRNFPTEVALVGDARETLAALLEICEAERLNFRNEDARARIAAHKAAWRRDIAPLASSDAMPIKPERLLREISDRVSAATLIVADASYVTGWAYSQIDCIAQGCTIISPRGTGGLGWGLPAAIGAKLGDPARDVVCLTGDGGFGYVLAELETAARYRVDLTVVVFNNSTLAFQKHFEQKLFGEYRECDLLDIDYAEVARAFKCRGERVTDPGEIGAALDRAMAAGGPALVDVVIDPDSKAPVVPLEDDDTDGASPGTATH